MSRFIVCNIMSLDGYNADSDGNPLVLPMDAAFDQYNLELLRDAGSLVLGADSYRMFMGFWPAQATNPQAGEVHREFGDLYSRIPVTVVSDSITEAETAPWQAQTTVVPRAEAPAHIKDLKAKTTGNILTFASRITWNALLATGLVDELHLIIGPNALANGTPTFTAPTTNLTPKTPRQLPNSTNTLLRYTTT